MRDGPGSRRDERDGDVRRSPSGRVPQWAMDEAVGLPAPPPPWRGSVVGLGADAHLRGRRRGRRRGRARLRRLGVLALVVLLAVAVVGLWVHGGGLSATAAARPAGFPSPGGDAQDEALGRPAPLARRSDAWRPLRTQEDGTTPVAWDPCRPVHYVTRPDGAPAGAPELLREAIARVGAATGLRFVDDGPTDEGPSGERAAYQGERYGDRWAPVLVTWVTPEEVPDIAAAVIAQAGPVGVGATRRSAWDRLGGRGGETVSVYVSGAVEVDAAQVADALARPGGEELVRAVFEHELGHLVGLAHVEDPAQLMFPETTDAREYGAGDLTGLSALGTGVCVPQV